MNSAALPLIVFTMSVGVAHGSIIVLDFEGLDNRESVTDFYNGGQGGNGTGAFGPDYDVMFSSTSLALIDSDAGGTGNFANEPSPDTVLIFLSGEAATMNVLNGFTDGFSFFYSSTLESFVTVYDGPDATGNVLAMIDLPALPSGTGDPGGGDNGVWMPVGVSFAGTAYSVDFGGTMNRVGIDNITLGSETPAGVPEPSSLALLGMGCLSLSGYGFRRRRAARSR